MPLNDKAMLDARSAASMVCAHLTTLRENATAAYWLSGKDNSTADHVLRNMERELGEVERELTNLREAMIRIRQGEAVAA